MEKMGIGTVIHVNYPNSLKLKQKENTYKFKIIMVEFCVNCFFFRAWGKNI